MTLTTLITLDVKGANGISLAFMRASIGGGDAYNARQLAVALDGVVFIDGDASLISGVGKQSTNGNGGHVAIANGTGFLALPTFFALFRPEQGHVSVSIVIWGEMIKRQGEGVEGLVSGDDFGPGFLNVTFYRGKV